MITTIYNKVIFAELSTMFFGELNKLMNYVQDGKLILGNMYLLKFILGDEFNKITEEIDLFIELAKCDENIEKIFKSSSINYDCNINGFLITVYPYHLIHQNFNIPHKLRINLLRTGTVSDLFDSFPLNVNKCYFNGKSLVYDDAIKQRELIVYWKDAVIRESIKSFCKDHGFTKVPIRNDVTVKFANTQFASYFNDNTFSDVVIKIGDKSIFAHRMVLSLSPVFKAMFENNFKENKTGVIEIANDFETYYCFIKSLYTGEIEISETNFDNLYALYHEHLLNNVIENITLKLCTWHVHKNNIKIMIKYADCLQNDELINNCLKYLVQNKEKLQKYLEFIQTFPYFNGACLRILINRYCI